MKKILLLFVITLATSHLMAEDYKYLTIGFGGAEKSIALETIQKITFEDGKVVITTNEGRNSFLQSQTEQIYFSDTATGIGSIKNTDEMGEMVNGKWSNGKCLYDLSGRLVNNPKKGIYILGNKKIVIK